MFNNVTGIILTGGESRRMGFDKGSIELAGSHLLEKTVELFKRLFPDVIVVSKEVGRFGDLGCREVKDILPAMGAMVGIVTGLKAAETDYIFTAACDMPFLNEKVISLIIDKGAGFDIAIPEVGGRSHPLHALYSKSCYNGMKACMERGERGLNRFIKSLPERSVRAVTEDEIREVDPEFLSLFNMNTPEELERAEDIVKNTSN